MISASGVAASARARAAGRRSGKDAGRWAADRTAGTAPGRAVAGLAADRAEGRKTARTGQMRTGAVGSPAIFAGLPAGTDPAASAVGPGMKQAAGLAPSPPHTPRHPVAWSAAGAARRVAGETRRIRLKRTQWRRNSEASIPNLAGAGVASARHRFRGLAAADKSRLPHPARRRRPRFSRYSRRGERAAGVRMWPD